MFFWATSSHNKSLCCCLRRIQGRLQESHAHFWNLAFRYQQNKLSKLVHLAENHGCRWSSDLSSASEEAACLQGIPGDRLAENELDTFEPVFDVHPLGQDPSLRLADPLGLRDRFRVSELCRFCRNRSLTVLREPAMRIKAFGTTIL